MLTGNIIMIPKQSKDSHSWTNYQSILLFNISILQALFLSYLID